MEKIVAFCGGMGAGKDTFGAAYQKYMEEKHLPVVHLTYSSALREELEGIRKFLLAELFASPLLASRLAERENVSFIDTMRFTGLFTNELECNRDFTFYDRTKGVRDMLVFWGKVRTDQDTNYFVRQMNANIKNWLDGGYYIYITDARRLSELRSLKERGACIVILDAPKEVRKKRILERDGFCPSDESMTSEVETEYMNFSQYDYFIDTTKESPLDFLKRYNG